MKIEDEVRRARLEKRAELSATLSVYVLPVSGDDFDCQILLDLEEESPICIHNLGAALRDFGADIAENGWDAMDEGQK